MAINKLVLPLVAGLGYMLFSNAAGAKTGGTSTPPLPPRPPGTDDNTVKTLAGQLVAHLNSVQKYKENKALVTQFQTANGGLKIDGMYGPNTALAICALGFIPPKPFYWSAKTSAADKANYLSQLARYAAGDPSRASQWAEAMNIAST